MAQQQGPVGNGRNGTAAAELSGRRLEWDGGWKGDGLVLDTAAEARTHDGTDCMLCPLFSQIAYDSPGVCLFVRAHHLWDHLCRGGLRLRRVAGLLNGGLLLLSAAMVELSEASIGLPQYWLSRRVTDRAC